MPARHPEPVLERMARHVGHELRMVGGLLHDAGEVPVDPTGLAVLEAYLLHVRTLSTFLGTSSERAWPDDVVADDYFRGSHEPFAPLTSDDRRDIDQRLSHLTLDRLAVPPLDALAASALEGQDRTYWGRRVLKGFTRFVDALQAESPARAAWFEGAITDAKRSARPVS